jgi:hypothetical protein
MAEPSRPTTTPEPEPQETGNPLAVVGEVVSMAGLTKPTGRG